MVNRERLIELFKELVMVDSETGHERAIADILKKKFSELGLEVVEDDSMVRTGHGAGNIIATLEANVENAAKVIYFTSHMDTVTPGKAIKPEVEGEYIVSDGTTILGADDKAGIAAMLEALAVIKEYNLSHGKIQFLITVGEESGLKGSKNLQEGLLQSEYGFAFDSNGPVGNIIVAAPTQARISATVHGRSAHAGVNPEDGISAIQVASYAISKMKLGRIDNETTANIGRFEGGKATNVVCDRVDILAEARSIKEEKLLRQIEHMKNAFDQAAQHFSTNVDFTYEIMYPAFHFSEADILVQNVKKAIEAIGREPKLITSGGGSDANVMNGLGIPTVNLGIGMENIHTTSERIAIEELFKATELIIQLIRQYSK
ncbi:hypothetical protein BHF71_05010 [Vulcanibacillus modesticaldus]|uniref:Peptidase M20 dimerisation domain-containing protein n=1 Tax=Vulcanibacillus modesticaldus TaxID=337097 RepID=A0A1D2YRW9_9BACI|nr:M20/M25/M40 family metallo-hydrolase [Vulcanibacillus modesticaldus]OEF95551.1 hypothetical protein BHF71_05010 [Vulcanibacillus modesticaldus]